MGYMKSYLKLMTLGLASFTMWSEVLGAVGNGWLGANEANPSPSWKEKLERALIKSNGMLPNLCVMELTGDAGLGTGHLPGGAALARFSDQIRSNNNGEFYVVTRPSGQNVAWGGAAQYMVTVTDYQRRQVKIFNAWYPNGITAAVLNNLNNAQVESREILRNPSYYKPIINRIAQDTNRPVSYLVIDPGKILNRIKKNRFSGYFSRFYFATPQNVVSDLDCSGHMTFRDGDVFTAIGRRLRVGGQAGAKKLKLLQMGQHPNQANKSSDEILISQNGLNPLGALFIVADVKDDKIYLIFEEGRRGRATERANQVQVGPRSYACPSWLGKFLAISIIGGVTAWYCLNTKAHAWDTANGYGITKFNFPKIPDGFTGKVVRVTLPPAGNFTFTQSGNQTLELPQHYSLVDTASVHLGHYFHKNNDGGLSSVLMTKEDFDEMQAFCNSQNPILNIPWLGEILRPMFCIPADGVEVETFNLPNNSTTFNFPTQPQWCTEEEANAGRCIPVDFDEFDSLLDTDVYFGEHGREEFCENNPNTRNYNVMDLDEASMQYLLNRDPRFRRLAVDPIEMGGENFYPMSTSENRMQAIQEVCRGSVNQSAPAERCIVVNGRYQGLCNTQRESTFLPRERGGSNEENTLNPTSTLNPIGTSEPEVEICPDGSCPEIVQNSINLGIHVTNKVGDFAKRAIDKGKELKKRLFSEQNNQE